MMRILVSGGTGFVGHALLPHLAAAGHDLVVLTRQPDADVGGTRTVHWRAGTAAADTALAEAVAQADAIINLSGASIAGRRWTPAYQTVIRQSRVHSTRAIVEALRKAARRPSIFLSGSAVGYYGTASGDTVLDEQAPSGHDFLAQVCASWEDEAGAAAALGLRVVTLRLGMVLDAGGGALPRMALPFHLYAGGPVGSGAQWMSWIHRLDAVRLIAMLLEADNLAGAINVTAPGPVRNRDFARALGHSLRRPSVVCAPAPILRLAFGTMADALLLGGQRVVPARAEEHGFSFLYPELPAALAHIQASAR